MFTSGIIAMSPLNGRSIPISCSNGLAPAMNSEKIRLIYKKLMIASAFVLIPAVSWWLGWEGMSWQLAIFFLVAAICVPYMSFSMPRGKSTLDFSDAFVFLSFILFGGKAAILVSAVSFLSLCTYLILRKKTTLTPTGIAINVGANALGTFATVVSVALIDRVIYPISDVNEGSSVIGLLATITVLHFFWLSIIYCPISPNFLKKRLYEVWLEEYFSNSLTQIAGAFAAYIFYKLLFGGSLVATIAGTLLLILGYLNYRRTVDQIDESMTKADLAEFERNQIEIEKAKVDELYNAQLKKMLAQEESTSKALRASKERFEYAAYHDPLTDLANRLYILKRLAFILELGLEQTNQYYVLYFNLSRFKNINDSLGHSVGDQVLRMIALRLRRTMREEDTLSRIGGDEFALIIKGIENRDAAMRVARKVYDSITKIFTIRGTEIYSDIHMGVVPLQFEHVKPEDAIRDATIAMQQAKVAGVPIAMFDKSSRTAHLEMIRIEADLRTAAEHNQLTLNYQPLISLDDGRLIGFEALLRWTHPKLGFVSPGTFIPIAEESGSIIPITNWVLGEACNQLSKWNHGRSDKDSFVMSINISGKHLRDYTIVRDIQRALSISEIDPRLLKVEITESTAMEDPDRSIAILESLTNLGIQLSIDDFGTGYSSLSYLHKIPFHTLKIDRSFIMNLDSGAPKDRKILESIVALTKNLNKQIIAEGIETADQLEIVKELGCEFGQGYLFSRPLPVDELTAVLENLKPWIEHNPEWVKQIPANGAASNVKITA